MSEQVNAKGYVNLIKEKQTKSRWIWVKRWKEEMLEKNIHHITNTLKFG